VDATAHETAKVVATPRSVPLVDPSQKSALQVPHLDQSVLHVVKVHLAVTDPLAVIDQHEVNDRREATDRLAVVVLSVPRAPSLLQ
jgi:hypothetical protein